MGPEAAGPEASRPEAARLEPARCVWEVTAGLIPGRPDPEHTRRWVLTSREADSDAVLELWQQRTTAASDYARSLTDPRRLNWARLDWVWF